MVAFDPDAGRGGSAYGRGEQRMPVAVEGAGGGMGDLADRLSQMGVKDAPNENLIQVMRAMEAAEKSIRQQDAVKRLESTSAKISYEVSIGEPDMNSADDVEVEDAVSIHIPSPEEEMQGPTDPLPYPPWKRLGDLFLPALFCLGVYIVMPDALMGRHLELYIVILTFIVISTLMSFVLIGLSLCYPKETGETIYWNQFGLHLGMLSAIVAFMLLFLVPKE